MEAPVWLIDGRVDAAVRGNHEGKFLNGLARARTLSCGKGGTFGSGERSGPGGPNGRKGMNGTGTVEGHSSVARTGRDTDALEVNRTAAQGTKMPGIDLFKRRLIGFALSGAGAALTGSVPAVLLALPAEAVVWRVLAIRTIREILGILVKVKRISDFVERVETLIRDLSARENVGISEEGIDPVKEALGELPTLLDDRAAREEITIILKNMGVDDKQLTVLSERLERLECWNRKRLPSQLLLQYETTLAVFELRGLSRDRVSLASNDLSSIDPQALAPAPVRDPTEPLACGFRVFASVCGQ